MVAGVHTCEKRPDGTFRWNHVTGLPLPPSSKRSSPPPSSPAAKADGAGHGGAEEGSMRVATWNIQGGNIVEDNINELIEGLAEESSQVTMMQGVRGQPARTQWLYEDRTVLFNDYGSTGSGTWHLVTAVSPELFNQRVGASTGMRWASLTFRSGHGSARHRGRRSSRRCCGR